MKYVRDLKIKQKTEKKQLNNSISVSELEMSHFFTAI